MENIIDKVNCIKDLKNLDIKEKKQLAKEYRELIIQTVSKNGGHLASNLGVVELTLALHSVFNVPNDSMIWDVGHQIYTHKILTGRKDKFSTLRKKDGIAGFPKVAESECDCFNTGHSSTSISAALGMARARDIKKESSNIIAIIGDGALTGGMALEGLNDAGSSKTRLIVILNDNTMSIAKNVGGISMFLSKLRTRKFYASSNNRIKAIVKKIPYLGEKIIYGVRIIKRKMKHLLLSNMFFEDMGFKYFGPIDGHDIEKLENILNIVKKVNGPVLVHVVTKKGKGYAPAEENPDKFHGIGSFDIKTGMLLSKKKEDYSEIFGKKLIEIANKNKDVVAITAAMKDGTGLSEFAKKFPNRFFDVGIAEQHAVCFAAGLASSGMKPIVSIYSSFYQRAYDQIINDVCIQKLPVIMCSDRAGIVGKDGETHQGIMDLSFCSIIPNLTVISPKDFIEFEQMLEFSLSLNSPVFIRYPRGGESEIKFDTHVNIVLGKSELLQVGEDISIIAIGNMVPRAIQVAEELNNHGISCEVINARFIKPLDEKSIKKSIEKTKNVITIEDNILNGGLGSKIKDLIIDENLQNIKIKCFGYPDEFVQHGEISEIEEQYGINVNSIVNYCINNTNK